MDGVVAGAQEDPVPQLVDGVRRTGLDTHQAAALRYARQIGRGDPVLLRLVELGQHGVREEHLERGGGGQPVVRAVGGQHLPVLAVRDEPRLGGKVRNPGRAAETHLYPVEAEPLTAHGGGGRGRCGPGGEKSGGHGSGGEAEHCAPGGRSVAGH